MDEINPPPDTNRTTADGTSLSEINKPSDTELGGSLDSDEGASSKIVPLYEVLVEVGGSPDECGVTLGIHGDDLDPDEISRLLGVPPTSAHRRGERLKPQSRAPFRQGAWFLERRGRAPLSPEELTKELLDLLPTDPGPWLSIREQFEIRLVYGLHFSGWNKGFDLPPELVVRIAAIGATMGFDLYAYGEEEGPP